MEHDSRRRYRGGPGQDQEPSPQLLYKLRLVPVHKLEEVLNLVLVNLLGHYRIIRRATNVDTLLERQFNVIVGLFKVMTKILFLL